MKHRMQMPRINTPKYHVSDDRKKINYMIYVLNGMNYGVGNARGTVEIIEKLGVDKFQFDYPYGSFEEYKKHVLAGEFDVDVKSIIRTPEEEAELEKAVKEGKLWVTY